MSEKSDRDRAVFGALFPGMYDDEYGSPPTPNFDSGARDSAVPLARRDQRPPAPVWHEPGGWVAVEFESGADWLFGSDGDEGGGRPAGGRCV